MVSSSPTPSSVSLVPTISWHLKTAEISGVQDFFDPIWLEDEILVIGTWNETKSYWRIPLSSDQQPAALPMPTPFFNLDPDRLHYSTSRAYLVECGDKGTTLYRTGDGQALSTTDLVIPDCRMIQWAPDESALNFALKNTETDSPTYTTLIYIWQTNSTQPYAVGKGSYMEDPGNWSPDRQHLAVEINNLLESISPDDEYRYDIIFLDGRQQQAVSATLSTRSAPGVYWLTNEIVFERNFYAAVCSSTTYFVARTGEEIPEMSQSDCYPGEPYANQGSILSPNKRFFMVDKTETTFFADDQQALVDYVTILFDIWNDQSIELNRDMSTCLDFVGWSQDSKRFYFIRRQCNSYLPENPLETYGLYAYDPGTEELTVINSQVRLAWPSPDRKRIFGVVHQDNGYFAGMFNPNGIPLGPFTPIHLSTSLLETNFLDIVPYELSLAWSPDGRKVSLVDSAGIAWIINGEDAGSSIATGLPMDEHPWIQIVWSPDGTRLLVIVEQRVWIVYLDQP